MSEGFNPHVFEPFDKVFEHFTRNEKNFIWVLVARYKMLCKQREIGIGTNVDRELSTLQWVLTLLRNLEHYEEEE